jgi:hypothetical protein
MGNSTHFAAAVEGSVEMPTKAWTFSLDDGPHTVVLEFSYWSAWEKLTVDGKTVSEGDKMTLLSRYQFAVNGQECHIRLSAFTYTPTLTVDGLPVELLPCNTLLRAATAQDVGEQELLRPAGTSPAREEELEQLLRPAAVEEDGEPDRQGH